MKDRNKRIRYKADYSPYLIIVGLVDVILSIPILIFKQYMFIIFMLSSYIIVMLIMFILKKMGHTKKISNEIYEKVIPSDLNPVFVRMLFNGGNVDKTCLATTVADLFKRKYFKILQINRKVKLIQTNKKEKNLTKFEKVVLKAVPKRSEKVKTIYFNEYREAVLEEFPKELINNCQKKEKYTLEFVIGIVFGIIVMPLTALFLNRLNNSSLSFWFSFGWLIFVLIFNVVCLYAWYFDDYNNKKKTKEESDWSNFLTSLYYFAKSKNKDINLWNYYYVYGIMADLNPREKENMLLLIWQYFK